MWGETEGLMLLFWSALFVGRREVRWERWEVSEVARWERWEGSKVEKVGNVREGNEVARWERWEGSEVARWGRWKNGEVGRWEVSGFVQGWGMQGESKISSFCF